MAHSHILAVMGVTGAGKSSFIKKVTGDPAIKVGHSQESETKSISSHDVCIRGRKFTLVDTPGFDDLHMTDSVVLKTLVDWLADTYRSGQKLSGILYLHRITETRMRGTSLRNLNMFKQLVGEEFYKNLTLGTTCWSLVPSDVALGREKELKMSDSFWKGLTLKGARLERIPEDANKACDLVYQIASHDPVALQTQRDIVDLGKSFSSLAVAKSVNHELEELRKKQEAEIRKREQENRRRLALEEQRRRLEMERIREKNKRIEEHQRKQNFCQHTWPTGRCDNSGCNNKLKEWTVIWHCCSCYSGDNYWQCGGCGHDCGNSEHPWMSRIDNDDDDCVVM